MEEGGLHNILLHNAWTKKPWVRAVVSKLIISVYSDNALCHVPRVGSLL